MKSLDFECRGPHQLGHHYASVLIESGAKVKVVQSRLGHSSATETLDTYAHLWPDSDDSTRATPSPRSHGEMCSIAIVREGYSARMTVSGRHSRRGHRPRAALGPAQVICMSVTRVAEPGTKKPAALSIMPMYPGSESRDAFAESSSADRL